MDLSSPSAPEKFDPSKPPRVRYANGQSEAVAFRTLSITERQRYIRFLEERDTVGIVAFCAGRNAGWIDSLTEDCFDDLANWFFLVNFSWVMERASRDPITSTLVHPFVTAMDRVMAAHPGLTQEAMATASSSARSTTSSPSAESALPSGSASPSAPAPVATAAAISAPA